MDMNYRGQILKRVQENYMLWFEKGSDFGKTSCTPSTKISKSNSTPFPVRIINCNINNTDVKVGRQGFIAASFTVL